MGFYFEDFQSMHAHEGMNIEKTLEAVARRYIGQNPAHPFTYRAFSRAGILRGKDYRYEADFNKNFPNAKLGQYVYAWAKIWADADSAIRFDIDCHSPVLIYVNGERIFRSDIFQERYFNKRTPLEIGLKAGWNHFVVRVRKTLGGFGAVYGTWLGKLPYYFLVPDPAREGQEGWIFTEPRDTELDVIPGAPGALTPGALPEKLKWLPSVAWDSKQRALGQMTRLFGKTKNTAAIGWTRAQFLLPGNAAYALKGRARSKLSVTINGEVVYATGKAGPVNARVSVPFGIHDIIVRAECTGGDWGYELALSQAAGKNEPLVFLNPANMTGTGAKWLYLGPIPAGAELDLDTLTDLNKLHDSANGGRIYWRVDEPDTWVRPYNDNALYGKWNYPLGVTLYGLLHAGAAIHSEDTRRYVVNHFQSCCDTYDYAMWDREQYGGATNVHHLLTSLDSLDDCGSAGSAMLEVAKYYELRGSRKIADVVADHISNKQVRLPDGTFFRKNLMHTFHEDTMWADDLYMSVPFLVRYYQLTNERKYIDDAARQFIGFKKHLYIPRLRLMSHVYDFMRGKATGIPWGRGNGWVLFSLSELLAVLSEKHKLRPQLLDFFLEFSAGILAQQDAAGMFHQVVNEHDSYPETSCTAMFMYGFSRGVRNGWYKDPAPYIRAAYRAWEAINKNSIDKFGNVHGVCRGSEFSFQSEYYKRDLLWNLNDTHGIGIVLLAGIELCKLRDFLQEG
ncbi:unsaturated rhamnogalacturonyl hydrolase [Ereboglobus sp. PH5-10]|uniref:glycoside hydrolase family 88/105 protein n=1 Tax=Ereboglobus sp. PH5-10 TaxID=2940629 RepID=UPI002406343B|nr:glycoside hydrolase family 88 protein [Ereboglobus sp. PH5-10]MDF9827612.1 unsaturated rhamnogalacturonyl hydrolase [Ereboglobus sp. PH5-10]